MCDRFLLVSEQRGRPALSELLGGKLLEEDRSDAVLWLLKFYMLVNNIIC